MTGYTRSVLITSFKRYKFQMTLYRVRGVTQPLMPQIKRRSFITTINSITTNERLNLQRLLHFTRIKGGIETIVIQDIELSHDPSKSKNFSSLKVLHNEACGKEHKGNI